MATNANAIPAVPNGSWPVYNEVERFLLDRRATEQTRTEVATLEDLGQLLSVTPVWDGCVVRVRDERACFGGSGGVGGGGYSAVISVTAARAEDSSTIAFWSA
jgi:hypothetical protein